ncbi:hypothetical protein EJV47_22780 [Hymenobacter gummosus]|uniref:Uncharacterized protein n=1 Tax=Hymenobacter gummosus TaxID=1776032 RepID=A0A431TWS3_9BACT|nr:hypothetical protein [Hymenobacter gummosus]RTQ45987.1 hypothetical protein EJV47_22780 [Hymenobacter gummosus]
MNARFLLLSLGLTALLQTTAQAQVSDNFRKTAKQLGSTVFKDKLPEDLPQAKILFIRFAPVEVPAQRPQGMSSEAYTRLRWHNQNCGWSTEQLRKAAQKYPFAYRITTQDSIGYYRDQGYKYLLLHDSFNSFLTNDYQGVRTHTSMSGGVTHQRMDITTVDLYVQDLTTNNFYVVDQFREYHLYKYSLLMPLLTKKVGKTFPAKS